jgi:hypothetical protein
MQLVVQQLGAPALQRAWLVRARARQARAGHSTEACVCVYTGHGGKQDRQARVRVVPRQAAGVCVGGGGAVRQHVQRTHSASCCLHTLTLSDSQAGRQAR